MYSLCSRISSTQTTCLCSLKNFVVRRCYRDILYDRMVAGPPVITMPVKLATKVQKLRERRIEEEEKFRNLYGVDPRRDRVIIECPEKKANHYQRQKYPPRQPLKLGSELWTSNKRAGESVVINQQVKAKNVYFSEEPSTFDEFGLSPEIIAFLKNSFEMPTRIQDLAIPKILAGKNVIIGSETGSGKTLAYLAPIVSKLLHFRLNFGAPQVGYPRALVFAPSFELASQIFDVLKEFVGKTELVAGLLSTRSFYPQALQQPCDIVVCTPGTTTKFKKMGAISFDALLNIVIDEADTLLSDSFRQDLLDVLEDVTFRPNAEEAATQLTLVSATFPAHLDHFLAGLGELEMFERVGTRNLHFLQPHVTHRFIRVTRPMGVERFVKMMKYEAKVNRNVLVFVGNRAEGVFLLQLMKSFDIRCDLMARAEKCTHCPPNTQILADFLGEKKRIMIATDLGSRGLDTVNVEHVINYHFPKSIADYLHRAGRVARVGGKSGSGAMVTSFVHTDSDVELTKQIETSIRLNEPLVDIFEDYEQKMFEKQKLLTKSRKERGKELQIKEA